jgi:putative ABC transport system permease protein
MAWRETRGSIRHFTFFLACIALGVSALVGITGFASSLEGGIQKEARNLMAGDLEIHSHQPLSSRSVSMIRSLQDRGILTTTVAEFIAMVSEKESKTAQLVELKAVGAGYPFYGKLVTDPPEGVNNLIDHHALVEEALLVRLNLQVGDRIKLGEAEFTISGIIKKEPDRVAGAFSLGPRVMISQEGLIQTKLIQPGSRVRYRTLLKLPSTVDLEAIKSQIEIGLADERVRVTSYQEAQPRLRRFLKNLTTYLGLVGLTALLVGGIGVANSVRVFLRGKLDTLAILKCLGAGSGTIFRIYLLQALLLGLFGCLVGAILGLGAQKLFPVLLSDFFPADLEWHVSFLPAFRGIVMGLLTTLLFSLEPLLGIWGVPPAYIFRRDFIRTEEVQSPIGAKRSNLVSAAITTAIVTSLILLTLWQAGSFNVGALFIAVLAASLLALKLSAVFGIRLVKAIRRPKSLIWRHGLANLYRPGTQTTLAILSIGVGVTVILAVHLIENSLLRQVGENLPKDAPSFFFIDIQTDQKDQFQRLLSQDGKNLEMTPIVHGRLHAVGDYKVTEMDLAERSDAWYFQREYVMTSQEKLPKDNKVKRGQWWADGTSGLPQISVEEDAAHHLGVDIGSSLTFDIQGVLVKATVASIREVNWGSMSTNFFVIFSPGVLEGAPTTFIATIRSRPEEDTVLQRQVVSAFPNVTAISVRNVLDSVRHVLERIGLVVRFMAVFTIAVGLVVLAGAIATTRHWRTRESVIFKTLGATRGLVAKTFAVEYAVLGSIAGVVGSGMASLLAFIFLRFVMDLSWYLQPGVLVTSVVCTLILTVLTGFLTTFRILGQKPLAILRHE